MPTHDAEWRKAVSEAQKRRWERARESGAAAALARKLSEQNRRLTDQQVDDAIARMSRDHGPVISEVANELGVGASTLRKYLRRKLGKEAASVLVRARQSDAMKGNKRGVGRTPSEALLRTIKDRWGEKNPNWKGNDAGYEAMHTRLHRRRGKASECSVCGTRDRRHKYDWANLSGRYDDPDDYAQMCRKCHIAFDAGRRSAG
jgi:AraC-like DNA-binding protein